MRRHGGGSLFQRASGYWVGQYTSKRDGKRKSVTGWDREVVERRLAAAVTLSNRQRRTDRLFMHTRRARAEGFVREIIGHARAEAWTAEKLAAVIVAQLAPGRIRANIFGPCVYCGTWLAGTIDHVMPSSRGGSNDLSNLVSACAGCNSGKRARTPDEWAA